MFRGLRNVLTHSRVPLRVGAAVDNANVYRVRFVQSPREKSKRFARTVYFLTTCTITLLLGSRVAIAMSKDGETVFIPLTLATQEPPKKFTRTDPEVQAFIKFGSDRKRAVAARRVFEDKTIQVLEASYPGRVGKVKQVHSLLYFHYPQGPPPGYYQKGLLFKSHQSEDGLNSVIDIALAERTTSADEYLRKESILYPRWMFNAVKNSVHDIWAGITTPRDPNNEEDKFEDIFDVVQYGVDLSQWTLANLKDDLKKTQVKPGPPAGHVIIDGMVQVTSDKMLINVDLTGSFNPNNLKEFSIYRMQVRYSANLSKPKKPVEVAKKLEEIGAIVKAEEVVEKVSPELQKKVIGKLPEKILQERYMEAYPDMKQSEKKQSGHSGIGAHERNIETESSPVATPDESPRPSNVPRNDIDKPASTSEPHKQQPPPPPPRPLDE